MPCSRSNIIEYVKKKLRKAKSPRIRIIYAESRLVKFGAKVEKFLEWVLERLRSQMTAGFWKNSKR
jgi:hypothetical protein